MPVIATDIARISNLVKQYDAPQSPELFNDVVTVNEASQATYTLGTVLGKITASGKYIISKQAAADGSQTPAAVYIGNAFGDIVTTTIPATTDTQVLAITRGKVVLALSQLNLDSSFGTAPQKAAAYAALKAAGILVETQL